MLSLYGFCMQSVGTARRAGALFALGLVLVLPGLPVQAGQETAIKIGVLTDLSGAYSDLAGQGSVLAVKMAVEDFKQQEKPAFPIEVLSADHQLKADVASTIARSWFDREGVHVVMDLVSSATALSVMKVAKEKNRLVLMSGPGSTRIINEDCNDVTVLWTYDTYSMARGTAQELVRQGRKSWFMLTADYAFGHSLEKDASEAILANGGKTLGSVRYPFPGNDFSSYLLKAQSSGAEVIGLANAGTDTINTIKQAADFGITQKQTLAGLLLFISEIHSLGLKAAQGAYLTTAFYWDRDDASRSWAQRFFAQHKKMPTMVHAGLYSATMHYLKAVKAVKGSDTQKVMAQMKKTKINDFFARNGYIRDDGRMMHSMFLARVKKPEESKAPWDYYTILKEIPAEEAANPLSASTCPLVKK